MPRFASIDMGTNTFRLLISELEGRALPNMIYSENRIVRLGEGFSKRKLIRPAATERAISALAAFQARLAREDLAGLIVMGTSALRDAENQGTFLETIKKICGFDVKVLSGEEEARLTLLGVNMISQGDQSEYESTVVIDIGGGSTELILAKRGENPFFLSLDLGALCLSEQYLVSDPPALSEIVSLEDVIDQSLSKIVGYFPKRCQFVGTAGTVTTLAAIDQKMIHYDSEKINGYQISRSAVTQTLEDLRKRSKERRQHIPGLEKGRADIIVAGTVILLRVMNRFGYELLHVSDYGLREGAMMDRFGYP